MFNSILVYLSGYLFLNILQTKNIMNYCNTHQLIFEVAETNFIVVGHLSYFYNNTGKSKLKHSPKKKTHFISWSTYMYISSLYTYHIL